MCDGDPPYTVAAHAGCIVGFQAYIPVELLCDGEVILSGKDEDTLVDPDYRGQGVLDAMYGKLFQRAERDRVAVLWGFTNTAVRPLLRNGYVSIGRFSAMQAPVKPHSNEHLGRAAACLPAGITIENLDPPDERCDRFSMEFGRKVGGVTLHLSERFLRWRLYDNPFRRYAVYAAYEGERMVGLAAFKPEEQAGIGYVSELAALPTSSVDVRDVIRALLLPGLHLFRRCKIKLAEARPAGQHPFTRMVRNVLAEYSFVPVPDDQATEFLVRPISPCRDGFLQMDRWRISEIMREY